MAVLDRAPGSQPHGFALRYAGRYPDRAMLRSTRLVCLFACLLAAGCTDRVIVQSGSLVEADPPDDEQPPADDGSPDEDDDPPPEDDDLQPVECVDLVIPTTDLPLSIEGVLAQGQSRFQPSCVDAVSAEVTFSFTAPRAATYVFGTQGSSFDTILYALGSSCDLPERGCNDDSNGSTASQISLGLASGETTVIVIDSFGEAGEWDLQVREGGTCPNEELASEPEVLVEGFLDGTQEDSVVPSCAGAGADIVYAWTPPFTSRWRISTAGSNFDTVLAVYSSDCQTELACNDDGPGEVTSVLDIELEAGVPVAIAVDSFDSQNGSFQLSIFPN